MARATGPGPGPEGLSAREEAEIIEFVEADSLEDMVRALPPEVVARYDARAERIGSAVALAMRRVDIPMFNRVVGLGLREPATESVLDAVAAVYRGANVRFMVQMSPAALTDELHRRLEARGWGRRDSWVNLIRGVEPPPAIPTDLRIECVGPAYAEAFADITCVAFELDRQYGAVITPLLGRPTWRHYLAFDGETPVAAGALFVRGEVGYLSFGATLPTHRRRGGQGAIMGRRIRDAAELGCRYLVTETFMDTPEHPNPSFHNMLRTGFRVAYARPNYIFFPSGWTDG